jgi:hypothetical protein
MINKILCQKTKDWKKKKFEDTKGGNQKPHSTDNSMAERKRTNNNIQTIIQKN